MNKKIIINPLVKKYSSEKRWVNYSVVKAPGRNTMTKIPYSPITKRKASSTLVSDWGTYEEALTSNPQAIGIVFTSQKTLLGIDIDHCLKDNQIDHEQKEQIAQLIIEADTYTEISPSGTGLHLYFEISEPLTLIANRHANFEAYTEGRYFTVTSNVYKEVREIRTITKEEALHIIAIIGYPWGKVSSSTLQTSLDESKVALPSSNGPLIEKMFKSKNGLLIKSLYEGTATAKIYKDDQSAADMAFLSHLAFWTRKDSNQMENIWLSSPLGGREKTQKRKDYRDRSIASAIEHCNAVYEDKAQQTIDTFKEDAPDLELLFNMVKGEKIYTMNTENICRILRHHSKFKNTLQYDAFKNSVEIKKKIKDIEKWVQFEDYDVINIQTAISVMFPFFSRISKNTVADAISSIFRENTIDSASDYITALKWDGTARLDTWLMSTYGTPDDIYHRAVGSNWMKGLIKRIIEPGCKFDYVLVLEGEQGLKKSTSLGVIGTVYKDQPSWHVETTMSPDNKDFFMQFQGKAIIEFSEGETLSRTEVKKMKAIITTQSDKYRPAYGRYSQDFPRRCVFAMTTNQTEYLKDETGNRRWLPVSCVGVANIEWLQENRDQLFAEAYQRVIIDNETIYEFPEEETQNMQSSRRVHNANQDLIADWYFNKLTETDRLAGTTVHQVYRDALHGGYPTKPLSKFDEMDIADVLKTYLKLDKTRKRFDGIQAMRWFMSPKTPQYFGSAVPTTLDAFVDNVTAEDKPF